MMVNPKDRNILRELARQVAEIAALPVQQETIVLWKALNGLRPIRPMVVIDQIPWHEMEVDGELTLHTEDDFCRGLEWRLRETLYRWKHMRVDMVVEPVIELSKVIHSSGWGIEQKTIESGGLGRYYLDQLPNEEDIEKIRTPEIHLEAAATTELEEKARAIFDGILAVRMQGWLSTMFNLWDIIVSWHSAEAVLLDLIDRPDFMHRIMARLTEANLSLLDQLESQGLLGFGQTSIHCSGAYTDELPAPGFDPRRPRTKDLWNCGMAQIFVSVSPAMHKEFEIDYLKRLYARFGLGYYGCCEPLHEKIDIIRQLPHVRKISMSPWADPAKGAERIGKDFVYSCKPNPAFLASDWKPDQVAKELRNVLTQCRRYGCPVEFILKDISTVQGQPQRLWEWAEIAMRMAES